MNSYPQLFKSKKTREKAKFTIKLKKTSIFTFKLEKQVNIEECTNLIQYCCGFSTKSFTSIIKKYKVFPIKVLEQPEKK